MKGLLFIFTILFPSMLWAQQRITISGYVRDAQTGEDLIAANVYNTENTAEGVSTNVYGFYSLSLKPGDYKVKIAYIGYQSQVLELNLQADTTINIALSDAVTMDSTVVVTAIEEDANVNNAALGTIQISSATIKKLPALMGEVDVLKVVQLLPGVLSGGEGNSGFYVRGGGIDQNLILLDDAVVYNSGHLLGFFSVFNADAIHMTTLIKGGMPANYGGRLSSALDIKMKEGNKQAFGVEGGLGLVASRLSIDGPLVKDKGSFILSGRRSYVFDLAQPFLKGTSFEGTNYYFYDFNAKANYTISSKDRLYLSGYFGRDVLGLENPNRNLNLNMLWGNATATLRWNHLFNDKLFMNTMLIFNDYNFETDGAQDNFGFKLASAIQDFGTKVTFDYYPHPQHEIKFGADYTYHVFSPSKATAQIGEENFEIPRPKKHAQEMGAFVLDNWKISSRFKLNYGVRFSMFSQLGPYTSADSLEKYKAGEIVQNYFGVEPRLAFKASVTDQSAIKAGFTLGRQYVHLVTNSTSSLPLDLWVPSSTDILPQWGVQYSLGYFHNFKNNMYETSLELYYKDLYNQLDYSETFVQVPETNVEDEFISGRGRAYGMELFVRKNKGKLTGWVSYTLSRSERSFDEIRGRDYLASFDRMHNLSVVASYDISKRISANATFVLSSGQPYTPIKSIYLMNFNPSIEYGLRNSARLPLYHRLDLSMSFKLTKENKPFESSLAVAVYNAYNRRNVFYTYTAAETDVLTGELNLQTYKVSLFPIIPSITWNFKWRQPTAKKPNQL